MSSSQPQSLATLQRWFQHVMTHPSSVVDGVRSSHATGAGVIEPDHASTILRPSASMSALQRIGVYHHAYAARLIDCLVDDYPALRVLLGADTFNELCRAYIVRFPPSTPSLNQLGAQLPRFCLEQRAQDGALLHDLACLEWARAELVHEPAVPPLTAADISAQQDAWEHATVTAVPALRLLTLDYPVHELHRALRNAHAQEHERQLPEPERSFVLVQRQGWSITSRALLSQEGALLTQLLACTPLGDALDAAADAGASEADITAWFQAWVAAGVFRSA